MSDEEDEGEDEKLKRQRNVSKNASRGWNHRTIWTLCS